METIKVESLFLSEIPHSFRLLERMDVTLSNGMLISIPEGFITDFASVPRLMWGIVIPVGKHNKAALIHDYLIEETKVKREFADREFRYWLKKAGVSRVKIELMYQPCRFYSFCKRILDKRHRLFLTKK